MTSNHDPNPSARPTDCTQHAALPRYPGVVEAFALYNDVMGVTDDPGDLANRLDILASTLERPRNLAYYEGADLTRQAATLLWGIIHNHPFADGNKRAGLHIAFTFARVNGLAIIAPEDAVVELGYAVAEGRWDEATVEAWLRRYTRPDAKEAR
jgi:death-on-curing protein